MEPGGNRPRSGHIRLLVVDDHRVFAQALATALGLERDIRARAVSSALEALASSHEDPPQVALVDLEMPGMGGTQLLRRFREELPEVRLVAISAHDDDLAKARALEAGAIGYVSKLAQLDHVAEAVRTAARGDPLVDGQEQRRLLRRLRHQRHQDATERQRANRLTPRQIEILQMMADGVPAARIAERLGVSSATFRTHVQNLITRLGVHSKTEALALAIRQGRVTARG